MPGYYEKILPPHELVSIPLEYVDMSDCVCEGTGSYVGLGDLAGLGEEPAQQGGGVLDAFRDLISGKTDVGAAIKTKLASTVVKGARFKSQIAPTAYVTPEDIFAPNENARASESQFSLMGLVRPAVELDTVGGTVKVAPWGDPIEGVYFYPLVIGGLIVAGLVLKGLFK